METGNGTPFGKRGTPLGKPGTYYRRPVMTDFWRFWVGVQKSNNMASFKLSSNFDIG